MKKPSGIVKSFVNLGAKLKDASNGPPYRHFVQIGNILGPII